MKALLSLLIFVSGGAFAADPASPTSTSQAQPEWMKYAVPGEGHKVLNDLVGTFSFNMKWWESPTSEAQESKGVSKTAWIMNKRILQEDVSVPKTKQSPAFKGRGLLGYDNVSQQYQQVWFDDMSTGIMTGKGTMDAATKTITSTGTMSNMMTGEKDAWYRSETKLLGKNEHSYTMYSKGKDGKEYKSMEITYKRK